MATLAIGLVLFFETAISALALVFIQRYGIAAEVVSSIPLSLMVGKGAFTASIIRPSMWYLWGNFGIVFILISAYDHYVCSDLGILILVEHSLIWMSALLASWICHASTN